MRFTPVLLGLALATSVAACSANDAADEDAANFTPPTAQPRADFARSLDTRFGRLDRNNDSVIQADEMERRRGGGGGAGNTAATAEPGSGGARGGARAALLKALDTDGDGQLTRTEFVTGSLTRFDKADADHNQILTSDERRASGLFGAGAARSAPAAN